jgi:hypothetical protein
MKYVRCPACSCVHEVDCFFLSGDREWACAKCGERGDGVAMCEWIALGRRARPDDDEDWATVLSFAARRGLCSASD